MVIQEMAVNIELHFLASFYAILPQSDYDEFGQDLPTNVKPRQPKKEPRHFFDYFHISPVVVSIVKNFNIR